MGGFDYGFTNYFQKKPRFVLNKSCQRGEIRCVLEIPWLFEVTVGEFVVKSPYEAGLAAARHARLGRRARAGVADDPEGPRALSDVHCLLLSLLLLLL